MGTESEVTELQGHRTYTGMTSEGEAAVGRIAIWAARVEHNLVRLCVRLINIDDHRTGYVVTANMGASAVIELARKLVTDSTSTSDEDSADIQKMLKEAKVALVQRNQILHARVEEIRFGEKSVFVRRKKGTGDDGQNSFWDATLHGLDELDEIGARLFNISEDLGAYVDFELP